MANGQNLADLFQFWQMLSVPKEYDVPPSPMGILLQFLGYPVVSSAIKQSQDYNRAMVFLEGVRSDLQRLMASGATAEELRRWYEGIKKLPEWHLVRQFYGDAPLVSLEAVVKAPYTTEEQIQMQRQLINAVRGYATDRTPPVLGQTLPTSEQMNVPESVVQNLLTTRRRTKQAESGGGSDFFALLNPYTLSDWALFLRLLWGMR